MGIGSIYVQTEILCLSSVLKMKNIIGCVAVNIGLQPTYVYTINIQNDQKFFHVILSVDQNIVSSKIYMVQLEMKLYL